MDGLRVVPVLGDEVGRKDDEFLSETLCEIGRGTETRKISYFGYAVFAFDHQSRSLLETDLLHEVIRSHVHDCLQFPENGCPAHTEFPDHQVYGESGVIEVGKYDFPAF